MPQLSREQAVKLSKEAEELANWIVIRDFANQVYGENKAAKVETTTYSEYNDEGGYDDDIDSITTYDGNGNEIKPDYSLPFFQIERWRGQKSNEEPCKSDEDEDEDEFFDLFRDLSRPYNEQPRSPWVFFGDLPEDSYVYDLTEEPTLTLPIREEAIA